MIITENVKIKISRPTIKYYKSIGFNDIKIGDIIEVAVNFLPNKSNIVVEIKCDFCEYSKLELYQAYNRYISKDGKYRCIKCFNKEKFAQIKSEHGVDNLSQITEIKEKIKNTNLKKYGGHPNKLEENKIKIFKTNINRYGCKMPMQNNLFKAKQINTNFKKYGKHTSILNDEVKSKGLKTMFEKYGFNYSMQVSSIKDKIISNSTKTKIEKILNDDRNILEINYSENYYKCFCELCNNEYNIPPHMYLMRKIQNTIQCTICNNIQNKVSGKEIELINFIKENYTAEIITNSRSVISPLELDIYLPELNIAFEFNGLYWHSEEYKEKSYHLKKTVECQKLGINLMHIWEDDWVYKQDIVKSMVLNKLGKSNNKIFARKCSIKVANNKEVREFLKTNHIQGFVGSTIKLGLYYNEELVSLMTFGNLRKSMNSIAKEGSYELLRFCNKINYSVIGGASKLLNYFIKNYKHEEIISYSDYSRSTGNMYTKLGFTFEKLSNIGYYWTKDGIKYNRFNFRKDILVKEGYDSSKTELEIMHERGYKRIFDCGMQKWIYKNQRK